MGIYKKVRNSAAIMRRALLALSALSIMFSVGSAPVAFADTAAPDVHPATWVEDEVSFQAGGMTIYGTYRHPAHQTRPVPAALIIAGSGPTDRNGNTPLVQGDVGTLRTVANWLSEDGVASLRYDKLGTGETGTGPYHKGEVGIGVYEQEAAAALNFLASQPGVNRQRLAVFGHSEGALYSLLLADGLAGPVPRIRALGLLEPLSIRYLDKIAVQLTANLDAQVKAGHITKDQEAKVQAVINAAIQSLRTTGTVPANLPYGLSAIFSPSTAKYLSEIDRYDPAQLAATLHPLTPVLTSCSDADIQVSCDDVHHLLRGLVRAPAIPDFVQLQGVDHVLKEDPSGTADNYGKPLPFSTQLQEATRAFTGFALEPPFRW